MPSVIMTNELFLTVLVGFKDLEDFTF